MPLWLTLGKVSERNIQKGRGGGYKNLKCGLSQQKNENQKIDKMLSFSPFQNRVITFKKEKL